MSLIIDLAPHEQKALEAKARARGVSPEVYARQALRRTLLLSGCVFPAPEGEERRRAADRLMQHLDAMAEKVTPETSPAEMEAAIDEALAEVRPRRERAS
jgi:hypothetical protein